MNLSFLADASRTQDSPVNCGFMEFLSACKFLSRKRAQMVSKLYK